MLERILEPEVMDSADDAHQYDAMDHSIVNALFATDLLTALADQSECNLKILDLGAGTAQIPIELAQRAPHVHVTAVDVAESMLELARENVEATGLTERIELVRADAKELPFGAASFPAVISNSIMHHIPEPRDCVAEAVRVVAAGGLLFHRDLARPADESQLNELVNTYAGKSTPYQRRLFAESLRAALALHEMQELVAEFGFAPATVQMTSDRHWTWIATRA